MGLKLYKKARDRNEKQIVMALVRAGATVIRLEQPCDLLIGHKGETLLVEVKRPPGPRGGTANRTLTKSQREFVATWQGSPLHVVTSEAEALALLGVTIDSD